jgi:hypothetical protein
VGQVPSLDFGRLREEPSAASVKFGPGHSFHFPSPLHSPSSRNNRVGGKLYQGRGDPGENRPAVILLHGWNGEYGYWCHFPLLARRLAWRGMTAVMIEMPYHGSRKPRGGAVRNFLSGDLAHMMSATRQAVADIRALVGWLERQGHSPIAFWGMSLGAWLGGLAASIDARLSHGVLVTPVPRIDRAIQTLEFCRHIRASMEGLGISIEELNLQAHPPRGPSGNFLVVEGRYDLFAPAETIEELWRAWGKPEIWRVKHGHISVLLSVPVMEATGRWLSGRLMDRTQSSR